MRNAKSLSGGILTAATLACLASVPARADINITLQDAAGKAIQGVSCAQAGGSSAVSDAAGKLVIRGIVSSIKPMQRAIGRSMLTEIPLTPGARAQVRVTDLTGRAVFQRSVSLGERVEFPRRDQGVYFASILSGGKATHARLTNLGEGLVFSGTDLSVAASAALAKSSVMPLEASIECSKAGFPTQLYRILDGTSLVIDFSKLALVPLFDASTKLEPEVVYETPTAIVTRFSDRARDRHAREDQFHAYDHYLTLYWENRTATIQITDEIAKGGTKIRVDQWTLWPLDPSAREFRAFYRGIGTVAEYHYNVSMKVDPADPLHYYTEFNYNGQTGKPAKIGDRMEIEVSQFLDKAGLEGRDNYYGTTYLYVVGEGGLHPWEPKGVFGDGATERENSYAIPQEGWLGGRTTIHQQTSNEPEFMFMQLATNMAPQNGQKFVHGRRLHHTNFLDGAHDEPGNPVWSEMVSKAGPNYVNTSCTSCHDRNGRALAPAAGTALSRHVFKVAGADGGSHPKLGSVLQPKGEGAVNLASWTETDGLRKPNYSFGGTAPEKFSARISPQLVGMGLLEAVSEATIQSLTDPDDSDKDGVSGRMNIVTDYVTGQPRMGRFGWKAGKPSVAHQVAGALNSDIGVNTTIYPNPDCGSEQTNCGNKGSEVGDKEFQNLVDYIALLGVRARRDLKDPVALQGEVLFAGAGCASCHTPKLQTSPYHPKAELRNQTIRPFTDMLLHDMGPGLADNLGEGEATGSEWRTAPLWNIGLSAGVSGGEGYLHDGRARTLPEAILWHGGEAEAAKNKFKAMGQSDKDALVKFLKSL